MVISQIIYEVAGKFPRRTFLTLFLIIFSILVLFFVVFPSLASYFVLLLLTPSSRRCVSYFTIFPGSENKKGKNGLFDLFVQTLHSFMNGYLMVVFHVLKFSIKQFYLLLRF